jgi:hypothetical protein
MAGSKTKTMMRYSTATTVIVEPDILASSKDREKWQTTMDQPQPVYSSEQKK